MIDVGELVRDVQALFPPERRTVAFMWVLWNTTVEAFNAVYQAAPDDVPDAWIRDAEAFHGRMGSYEASLEGLDLEAPAPEDVVRGLLFNFPGSGHTVPDFATPATLYNQASQLTQMQELDELDYGAGLQAAADAWGQSFEVELERTSKKTNWLMWGAVAIGGYVAYDTVRRISKGRRR